MGWYVERHACRKQTEAWRKWFKKGVFFLLLLETVHEEYIQRVLKRQQSSLAPATIDTTGLWHDRTRHTTTNALAIPHTRRHQHHKHHTAHTGTREQQTRQDSGPDVGQIRAGPESALLSRAGNTLMEPLVMELQMEWKKGLNSKHPRLTFLLHTDNEQK